MEASKSEYDKEFFEKEERREKEDRLVSELRKNQKMREDLEKNLYEIEKENERFSEESYKNLQLLDSIIGKNVFRETELYGNFEVVLNEMRYMMMKMNQNQQDFLDGMKHFSNKKIQEILTKEELLRRKLSRINEE